MTFWDKLFRQQNPPVAADYRKEQGRATPNPASRPVASREAAAKAGITSARTKPTPPTTVLDGGRIRVQGTWKTAYVSRAEGVVTQIGYSGPSEVRPGEWAQVDLLVEPDAAGYLKFSQCQITDPASGEPCELNDVQKHAIVKYLGGSYDWELHWQRAPESVKSRFAYSAASQPCGEQHDWDGCVCKRCGVSRPHEWGPVEEHDYSGLNVFDSRGTVKRVFAKACVHCRKEETVRTEY